MNSADIGKLKIESIPVDPRRPHFLHHYTSVCGVEGILKSKSVWASLLHFMNDSREWLYALDLVRQDLSSRIHAREDRNWLAFIAQLSESLGRIRELNICVFSLSAAPNQLSQWRAYCPPEGGYELWFDFETLKEHLIRHGFQLEQCVYDVEVQRRILNTALNKIMVNVGPLADDDAVNEASERTLSELAMILSNVAPVLKHPDFNEEREWRAFALVASNDARMSYHIKGSVVVPHCILELETESCKFPILQVNVGPNAHQELAMRGLQALAFKTHVSIGQSSTPLRNF